MRLITILALVVALTGCGGGGGGGGSGGGGGGGSTPATMNVVGASVTITGDAGTFAHGPATYTLTINGDGSEFTATGTSDVQSLQIGGDGNTVIIGDGGALGPVQVNGNDNTIRLPTGMPVPASVTFNGTGNAFVYYAPG